MTETPARTSERNFPTIQILGWCGILGPLIFVMAATVAGLLRPDYSPIHQAISDLGVGDQPWLLNISLMVMGAALVAVSIGLHRALDPRRTDPWQWIPTGLLMLPGIGFAWAGVFTEAPATLTLHWVVGMPLVGLGAIGGFITTGVRLRRRESWRGLGTYSIAAGLGALALIVAMFGTWTLGVGGLTERAFFLEILAWYAVIGGRLATRERSRQPGETA
ncbi:DUF998 domain-containing protein [Hamadaea tsunoensis]|uniref:DUF998 domain-containing protein n=1 Tax=Hamadaea tsunoensis TaxID=53368 RepID=UPI00040AB908|nr:DUF998 domain-containing protein [Hamadaea tsunoensis]